MERKPHRRAWELANGPIPIEADGRSYEIHHIDGNYENNKLDNLKCVTIREHFDIHTEQEDWLAVAAIANRMGLSASEKSNYNSLAGKQAVIQKKGWFANDRREIAILGGKATKGYKWYNNGTKQSRFLSDPGQSWKLGRLPAKNGVKYGAPKGLKLGPFWNNGKENKRAIDCPGDDWVLGKLMTDEQRLRRIEISKTAVKGKTWKWKNRNL